MATAPVWEHFEKKQGQENIAVCKICKGEVSRGSLAKGTKFYTTSNLTQHLKRKHPEEHATITNKKSQQESKQEQRASSSRSQTLTIEESFHSVKLWDINDARAQRVTDKIITVIARDNQPFSIVEDAGFSELIEFAFPKYKMPSRKYLTEKKLPEKYNLLHKQIEDSLEGECTALSLTSDIWTANHNNESFISLTGHWLNEDFKQRSAALAVRHFPQSHTGENIKQLLNELLSSWGIASSKVHVLVRDGAANIALGSRLMEVDSLHCFIHKLQLCIHDGILSQRSVIDLLSKARRIVSHFSHSSPATTKLKELQARSSPAASSTLGLVQDVTTRWNSTFYMLQRIHTLKEAVSLYAIDSGDIQNLNGNEWQLVERLLRILQPFEEVTRSMSKDSATISQIIPCVATLERYLAKEGSKDSGVQTTKADILTSLRKRFLSGPGHIYNSRCLTVSTLVDPRFKTVFFDAATEEDVKLHLLSMLCPSSDSDSASEDAPTAVAGSSQKDLSADINVDLWGCFDELVTRTDSGSQATSPSRQSHFTKASCELDSFLALPLLPRNGDVFLWWQANKQTFPQIADVARKFLGSPPSSVYSERLFSEAGNLYEAKRNRTLPRNAEKLLFLHHNIPRMRKW